MPVDPAAVRLYLGESPRTGETASDTLFSDAQIAQFITDAGNYGLSGALLAGWKAKAAYYARMIDMNESGAVRNMSQRFRQAASMVKVYQEEVAQMRADGMIGKRGGAGKSFDITGAGAVEDVVKYTRFYNRMPVFDVLAVSNTSARLISESLDDLPQ